MDLTNESIRAVCSRYQQLARILIYGPRAMGNYNAASDIDLTLVVGKDIDLSLETEIEFELDDLMLPYKFDISIYNKTNNPDFLIHIRRVGREFYNIKKDEGTAFDK